MAITTTPRWTDKLGRRSKLFLAAMILAVFLLVCMLIGDPTFAAGPSVLLFLIATASSAATFLYLDFCWRFGYRHAETCLAGPPWQSLKLFGRVLFRYYVVVTSLITAPLTFAAIMMLFLPLFRTVVIDSIKHPENSLGNFQQSGYSDLLPVLGLIWSYVFPGLFMILTLPFLFFGAALLLLGIHRIYQVIARNAKIAF